MQLQVECGFPGLAQPCSLCEQSFEMKEGRVILCDDQGDRYGEVCPQCISRGVHWINHQFERMVQQVSRAHRMKPPKRNPVIEEIMSVSGERRHDPSEVRSQTLSSNAF
ncbi:hypothetical protein [Leptolyngbya ohadii]|uniref:hypothetical protein n=1 Tax=Leptolyngbya ohadii TaxID=1962290 RepID=UPI000B59D0F3|nr:hypothetical protein [Leptolyngbya ohadii]